MQFKLLVPFAALTIGTLQAQTLPCQEFNPGASASTSLTASPFVGLNPSSRAWQFSPTSLSTVEAGAVFSGSPLRNDYMRVEVWDDVGGLPGSVLATGTLFSPLAATASWLGANFDATPTLDPNKNYWFVWVESGASLLSEDPSGTPLPRVTRVSTNAWSAAPSSPGKFRLFCNKLDGQGVVPFGSECARSNTQLPTAYTNAVASAGNAAFRIEGTNLVPGAPTLIVLGLNPAHVSTPLGPQFPPGCMLNADLVFSTVTGTAGLAEIGDQPSSPRPVPFGYHQVSLPLTGVGAGVFFSAQLFTVDTGFTTNVKVASTNAVQVTTF